MKETVGLWIHQGTHVYRLTKPERSLETIWTAHPGWGLLKARDMWIHLESNLDEIQARGYIEIDSESDEDSSLCPHCGMFVNSIPGSLLQKHFAECGGPEEDGRKMEEEMVERRRLEHYERKLLLEKLRRQQELAEQAKRDRFERAREQQVAQQKSRDKKKRLKDETKAHLKRK
ncbi:hypothetical protein ACFL2Q_18955 [Thermodesulfobacteriota bacterium]